MLEGTWVTEEVKLAVRNGYKVMKMFSNNEKYDAEKKSGGFFTEYVNTFLKVKQENSGYPSWCENDNDKDKYIEEYERNEGIRLEKDNICYNEGLRSISKLLLTSFWGPLSSSNK